MTEGRLVKVRIGMRAKGSCKETKKCFLSFFRESELRQVTATKTHLQALQHIEEVVHARQALDVLEDGHQQRRSDGQ